MSDAVTLPIAVITPPPFLTLSQMIVDLMRISGLAVGQISAYHVLPATTGATGTKGKAAFAASTCSRDLSGRN
jgi:hypothetical protein